MTFDYEGKVAVVTGAASGIGASAARAFAGRGADVVLADVDDAGLAAVSDEISATGGRAHAFHCDVSRDDDVSELARQTLSVFGRADVIMNNAGVAIRGPVEEIGLDDWRWIVDINLMGVVRGTHAFLPHLLERGSGWIVNTASIAGLTGSPVGVPYATTKQAVVGFSESLALYLRPKGIGVTVLCPAGVATNIGRSVRKVGTDPRFWAGLDRLGSGRGGAGIMTPDKVAELLLAGIDERRFVVPTSELSATMSQRAEALESNAGSRLDPDSVIPS